MEGQSNRTTQAGRGADVEFVPAIELQKVVGIAQAIREPLVSGYLHRGSITLVSGPEGGPQTNTALELVQASVAGSPVFGSPRAKSPAVLLTTMPAAKFAGMLRPTLLTTDCTVRSSCTSSAAALAMELDRAATECHRRGARTLLVDGFLQSVSQQRTLDDDSDGLERGLHVLRFAAAQGLAIIATLESRSDWGCLTSESEWVLTKCGWSPIHLRVEKFKGAKPEEWGITRPWARSVEYESFVVEPTSWGVKLVGPAAHEFTREVRENLILALAESHPDALTTIGLERRVGRPVSTVRDVLDELIGTGMVKRTGRGSSKNPYKYALGRGSGVSRR